MHFRNLSDFEAIRVKGAFYSRILLVFCNFDTGTWSVHFIGNCFFLLGEDRTHQGHVINNMVLSMFLDKLIHDPTKRTH